VNVRDHLVRSVLAVDVRITQIFDRHDFTPMNN
jgi:hypothetical protein